MTHTKTRATHYDIACEIIACHLGHCDTDRARALVEHEYRLRYGLEPGVPETSNARAEARLADMN